MEDMKFELVRYEVAVTSPGQVFTEYIYSDSLDGAIKAGQEYIEKHPGYTVKAYYRYELIDL